MSVTIPSDLISGVMQAAAPGRVRAATHKLFNTTSLVIETQPNFLNQLMAMASPEMRPRDVPGDMVLDVMNAADPVRLATAQRRISDMTGREPRSELAAAAPADAYRKFEAFLLRSAFEDMLPASETGAFGEGFAGGVWRSMAADQFASIFASHGGIGVARLLRERESGAVTPTPQWPYFESNTISAFQT